MVLLIFGFEPFILGLYCGGALRAITLPIGLDIAKTAGVERWGDVPFARFD